MIRPMKVEVMVLVSARIDWLKNKIIEILEDRGLGLGLSKDELSRDELSMGANCPGMNCPWGRIVQG
jgi:hypothetical protein